MQESVKCRSDLKWFDVWSRSQEPFQFYIGGRGIGKTYSTLYGFKSRHDKGIENKLLYLRLTDNEYKMSASIVGNPFKKINADHGFNIEPRKIAGSVGNIRGLFDGEEMIGYMAALSSFSGVRGVDFSDVSVIYVDEFNPSEIVIKTPSIKSAGKNLIGAYETVARNRELFGENPVRCILTANSTTVDNSILLYFKILNVIQALLVSGQHRYTDRQRGIYIEVIESGQVSDLKRDTALYKAIGRDSSYAKMALNNQFGDRSFSYIRKVKSLNEYMPLFNYCGICVYRHKNRALYHVKNSGIIIKDAMYNRNTIDTMQLLYKFEILAALQEHCITFDTLDDYYTLTNAIKENV